MRVFFAFLAMILAIAIAPTVAKDKNTKIKVDNQAIDKGMQEQGQKADISRRVKSRPIRTRIGQRAAPATLSANEGARCSDATRLQHAAKFVSPINARGRSYSPRRSGRGVAQPG
jgi:hypothetical protein